MIVISVDVKRVSSCSIVSHCGNRPSDPRETIYQNALKLPPRLKFFFGQSHPRCIHPVEGMLHWLLFTKAYALVLKRCSVKVRTRSNIPIDLQETESLASDGSGKRKFNYIFVFLESGLWRGSHINSIKSQLSVRNDSYSLKPTSIFFSCRWESLRSGALRRQKDLCDKLMALQQREIQTLSEWMTEIEDRISR